MRKEIWNRFLRAGTFFDIDLSSSTKTRSGLTGELVSAGLKTDNFLSFRDGGLVKFSYVLLGRFWAKTRPSFVLR